MLALIALLLSFSLAIVALPSVIAVAHSCRLFDVPDHRKRHAMPIPSLGGVALYGAFLLSLALVQGLYKALNPSVAFDDVPLSAGIVASTLILFFVGCKDDLVGMPALKKLCAQALAGSVLILSEGLFIGSLGGLFGITDIPSFLAFPAALLVYLAIVNAFNLIDGIDGLCASLGIVSTLSAALLLAIAGETVFSLYGAAIAGGAFAFLIFNWQPARLFLGDSGSLLIGSVVAALCLKIYGLNLEALQAYALETRHVAMLAFSLVFVPAMDTTRVFVVRITSGSSPFSADRNHIHHILLDRGLSVPAVVYTLMTAQLLVVGLTLATIMFKMAFGLTGMTLFSIVVMVIVQSLKVAQHVDVEHTVKGAVSVGKAA